MVGPRADLGPWADGPRSVSTGTPNSTPNSTLVMAASSDSSTWEAVEEVPWTVPVGTDRTRVVRHLAPVSTGEGNGDRPAPANPIHGNSLNYRPADNSHTDAGSTPPVRNPPAGWIEGGARQAPQRTTAPESSFHASSRGEQISSSPAAIPQAAPDPQVTNPHAGAQPTSSPSSAPATQATVPPLPYPWEEYWCTHYSLPFYYNQVSEERVWKRPESEGAEPASTPMQVRQDASAARAEEPASSSSNTVSPTITRTIHELRGTVIPFGTHVGWTVGWVMDTHPEFLWDFQREADLWYGERVSICRAHSTIEKLQDIIAEDSRRQTAPQATAAACSHRACALTYQGSNNVSPEGSYWLCGDCGTRRFMPHTVGVVREPGLGTERSQTGRGALPRISLMMDTGCHRSVAGSEWHRLMQMWCSENSFSPRPRNIDESFQFGGGQVVVSKRAWMYIVMLGDALVELDIAEIDGILCPALLGCQAMQTLGINLNLSDGTWAALACNITSRPLERSWSGQPVLSLWSGAS